MHDVSWETEGFRLGWASRISAKAPATKTVESDVPLLEYQRSSSPVLMMR